MMRCTRYLAGHPCGGQMREIIDGIGRVGFVCDNCIRFDKGLCRDCHAKRVGKALRCEPHRIKKRNANNPLNYAQHAAERCAYRRNRYHSDPVVRERAKKYARDKYAANPRTDLDRLYDREKRRRLRRGEFKRPPVRATA